MDLVDNLHRIHRVVTRGFSVTIENGQHFQTDGFGDATIRKGFLDYARCLVKLVIAHHEGEDEMLFPKLRAVVAQETCDRLEAQHQGLVDALAGAASALDRGEANPDDAEWLSALVPALRTAQARWLEHIALEEAQATQANFDAMLTPDGQLALLRALSEHGQKNGHIAPLAVPFVLFNLDGADRAALQRVMPPQVVNELVPGPWRGQWSAMAPFLLS